MMASTSQALVRGCYLCRKPSASESVVPAYSEHLQLGLVWGGRKCPDSQVGEVVSASVVYLRRNDSVERGEVCLSVASCVDVPVTSDLLLSAKLKTALCRRQSKRDEFPSKPTNQPVRTESRWLYCLSLHIAGWWSIGRREVRDLPFCSSRAHS
jgi:hypothetical protein